MHTNRTSFLALFAVVAFAVTVGVVSLAGASAPSEAPVDPAPAGPVVPDVVGLTEREAFLELDSQYIYVATTEYCQLFPCAAVETVCNPAHDDSGRDPMELKVHSQMPEAGTPLDETDGYVHLVLFESCPFGHA